MVAPARSPQAQTRTPDAVQTRSSQPVARPTSSSTRPATPTLGTLGPPAVRLASEPGAKTPPSSGPGEPLPAPVLEAIGKSLSIDARAVRVHSDKQAADMARNMGARAVTVGNHIYLGPGERATDVKLMAHEVAHTVQQRGAPVVQRSAPGQGDAFEREAERASTAVAHGESFAVQERTGGPRIQRLGISDALDYFADKANIIPGYRMFTIILGINPINMSRVERSGANILRAMIEFMPGGNLITRALDNYGIIDKIANWVSDQISSLGMTGSAIRQAVMDFIDRLRWDDIFDLGGVWNRAKRIFTEPIDRIINFAKGLVTGIIGFIKDAILRPLAKLAEGTRGYDLLKAVLGRDPITGDSVPQDANTLIGGFMKFIGQEEVWNNLKKANAVARAWAWFQGALAGLMGYVRQIPSLFISALQQLELADIILVPLALSKVARVFGGFVSDFVAWAGNQVLDLLQIIFEVLAPSVMPYVRRAAGAFKSIIRNPIGFIGNLVRAGIQGFRQFGRNFLTHLRTSLIGWLTGTMSGANIYIPQAFNVMEIIKFVLSVLGLTWQNIRGKLVRAIGDTAVRALEAGFDIVVTLVTQGPAAAWQKIVEGITNLRDMVMEQIMNFVRDRVVQAAITRLLTSLNPAGAFIQAIIAIYNTVMFFVERLRQIAQVAMSVIDSLAAIASGAIGSAANRVEQTMAGLLTLVISFLARIAGLGRVSDAVVNIVNRVRAPIDRALDRVVAWIVSTVRRLGSMIGGRDARSPEEKQRDLNRAARELRPRVRELFRRGPPGRLFNLRLAVWKRQYRLTDLTVQSSGAIIATINPTTTIDQLVPQSNQAALAVIHAEIVRFFAQGQTPAAMAAVRSTGTGSRQRPYDPAAAGVNPTVAVRAALSAPGGAPGETSWVMGTRAGQPVTAIIQRTRTPRSPGQGEVFPYDPTIGRRVTMGAYERSREVPGISSPAPGTGPTAATVVSGPFVRGGAGPSGSLAAGYAEEMAREGRVGTSISVQEAQAAGAINLLGAVESTRNPLGAVVIPSMMERTTREGATPGTAIGRTMGGAQAAVGSSADYRLVQHATSRFDPGTGLPRPPGSPEIVPDPPPRGARTPSRPGSEPRAAAHMNVSIEAMATTILQGMVINGVVLVTSTADLDRIRDRTREYMQQQYGRTR